MEYYHNPGKALEIEVAGERYLRHGIRTHFVEVGEDYLDLFRRYVVPVYRPGDWVAVSEKVAALCQGRVIHRQEIQVTWLARQLERNTPKIQEKPAKDSELFTFAQERSWKKHLDQNILSSVSTRHFSRIFSSSSELRFSFRR